MEISEAKMEWQMVEIATHVGSSARTVQNLHNLLYKLDYKMPLIHRYTEKEIANKILRCMSKFDTYLRGKCHDIINGEPGQRGNCERGTAILADDENGVPTATGEYDYALSLADVLTYFGKLWETRVESRDLPTTSPTNDISRSSDNEAHAAASGPRRAASGPRRAVPEHAFAATSAFTVRRPSCGFNRRNSLEALWAASFKDMDSSFLTSSDFAALDQDELADALRNGGVRHGCYSISVRKDANGVESVEIICYNCYRSCPSPKKSRELDFVIETLNELNKNRKQNPRAGPPNRVPYGQKTRDGEETARPARRQPTKFNDEGARVAVQEDECSICSDDEYAGSILPAPTRWLAHATSARASPAGARTCGLSFTGLSVNKLFDDEYGETDKEGAFGAYTVHHAFCATPADVVPEPAAPLATDLPAPAVVPVLAAPLDPFVAELDGPEPDVDGLLVPMNRSRRANATWDVVVESVREDSAWRFEDERHHEHAHDDSDPFKLHDDVLCTHDGDPDAQRAALAHNSFLYDTYHDGAPKIDGSADFAQGDSHGDDEPPAQIDVDDEPGQIDVIAAFAQSGSDGVEPRQPAPEHAYRLPRPMPEGCDEGYFDFLDYEPPLPDPDLVEPEPVEMHE